MRLRAGEGDDHYDDDGTDDDYDNHRADDDHYDDKNYDYYDDNKPSPRSRQDMLRILPRQQLPFWNMQGKQIRVRGAAGEEG
jgi:hypothetical protein